MRSPFALAPDLPTTRLDAFSDSAPELNSSILCRGAVPGLPAAGREVYPLSRGASLLFGGLESLDSRGKSDLYAASAKSVLSTECPNNALSETAVVREELGDSSQCASDFEGLIDPQRTELIVGSYPKKEVTGPGE